MPKPKPQRDSVFGGEEEQSSIPFIPASGINQIYETGFAGLPSTVFEDPVQKENEELKGQVDQLRQQLATQSSGLTIQGGGLVVEGFQFSPTGLIPPEEMSYEAWEQVGHLLFRLEGSIQWLIGDWLVYGVQLQYGDVKQVATALGRDEYTLYNYMSVSRSVGTSLRNEVLSYHHHVAVAKLDPDEQVAYLQYAAEHKLSVANFRKWIKEQQGSDQNQPALSAGNMIDLDTPARGFKKFLQRDPSLLKPKERAEVIGYMTEMERLIADYRRRMGL